MRIAIRIGSLALCALAGTAAGFVGSASKTCADCAGNSWKLMLLEVTSSDPTATHRRLWPEAANLFSGEGSASLSGAGNAGAEGVVAHLSARR